MKINDKLQWVIYSRLWSFTFTFSHLADAFVQSDVQGREQSSSVVIVQPEFTMSVNSIYCIYTIQSNSVKEIDVSPIHYGKHVLT